LLASPSWAEDNSRFSPLGLGEWRFGYLFGANPQNKINPNLQGKMSYDASDLEISAQAYMGGGLERFSITEGGKPLWEMNCKYFEVSDSLRATYLRFRDLIASQKAHGQKVTIDWEVAKALMKDYADGKSFESHLSGLVLPAQGNPVTDANAAIGKTGGEQTTVPTAPK
jgi:hypothetical protein